MLEFLLGHSATIRDGHLGREPSLGREDAGEGTEESVKEAPTAEQPVREAPTTE